MSKTGRHLTNVAFRVKVLKIIDKLNGTDSFPIARRTDDFEALNIDTFQVYMDALTEAVKPVPEPEPPPPPFEEFYTNFDLRIVIEGSLEEPSSQTFYLHCNHTPEEIISNIKNTFVNFKFSGYHEDTLLFGPWDICNLVISNGACGLIAYTSGANINTEEPPVLQFNDLNRILIYDTEEEAWYYRTYSGTSALPDENAKTVWFDPEEVFPPVAPEPDPETPDPENPDPTPPEGGEG